jgi:hypothetical protein
MISDEAPGFTNPRTSKLEGNLFFIPLVHPLPWLSLNNKTL